MSKRRKVQILAIAFLIVGLVLSIPNIEWREYPSLMGFIILVCGVMGSLISIFIPTEFSFEFNKSDWNIKQPDFVIIIDSKKHGLGKTPQIQTFQKTPLGYEKVSLDEHHDNNGNVTIAASMTFVGKVILK
jgi:hypothetical protein